MTKEEWDARQSVIRKVVDPETGRTRCGVGGGAQPLTPTCRRRGGGCCYEKAQDGKVTC